MTRSPRATSPSAGAPAGAVDAAPVDRATDARRSGRVRRRSARLWLAVWQRLPAPSPSTMRRLGLASLTANVLIVVTGGAVRLTGSGLGCPAWPRCTTGSLVFHRELGVHGAIEFGNRLLTFVLAAVVVVTWLAAMRFAPARRSLRLLATVLLLGVPAQALLGGLTVLTDLNPWLVSGHLLLSMALIAVAVTLVRRVGEGDRAARATVPSPAGWLVRACFVATWAVLYVGTVVTGSGPHAGDEHAPRTGLDPAAVSQLHADLVFLLVGLTVGAVLTLRAVDAPSRAVRAAWWLLGVELAQGVVGFVQYFTDLPVAVVAIHLLGACLVSAAATWTLLAIRDRGPAPSPTSAKDPAPRQF